jgi:hypothetical protein
VPETNTPHPDFRGIYVDTNILLRGQGWPSPSILLNNLFRLAAWWGIYRFLPEPVLTEAEEHWLRGLKDGVSRLSSATKELQRLASPVVCETKTEHPSVESLREEYGNRVNAAVKDYDIIRTPFTKRTVEETFGLATRYVLPFGDKAEGRGFQDAVILLSILDHLNSFSQAKAIFVTSDGDFKAVDFKKFLPGFDSTRLRIIDTLDAAVDLLWKPYVEETVLKPYEEEQKNALNAAKTLTPEISEFVKAHLTPDMLRPMLWDTVLRILAVTGVQVWAVDTPLPKPEVADRAVEILIKVSAVCRVRLERRFIGLKALVKPEAGDMPHPPEEIEESMSWTGGVKATANVANREFTDITFVALIPEKR